MARKRAAQQYSMGRRKIATCFLSGSAPARRTHRRGARTPGGPGRLRGPKEEIYEKTVPKSHVAPAAAALCLPMAAITPALAADQTLRTTVENCAYSSFDGILDLGFGGNTSDWMGKSIRSLSTMWCIPVLIRLAILKAEQSGVSAMQQGLLAAIRP